MEEETQDVKQAQESDEQESAEVSEDVKTPEQVIDRKVYEKVREDMQLERQAKREAQARLKEMEERLNALEQSDDDDYQESRNDPRLDVLYLMNKDPFVRENLDLIEERMSNDRRLDVRQAVKDIKSDMFDKIQREVAASTVNKPPKQEKVTATQETVKPVLSGDTFKDALEGKITNVPPGQLEAIKRVMSSLKK